MRADERQAGAAYTYAWWLTGDDDAAVAAIRAAFTRLAHADERDERPLTVLMRGVREHLGDVRPMCAASELALLHDGLDVELGPAAELAGIPAGDVTVQLAHGRLEGLLETVREEFDHPERLGGLAVGNPPDIAHARQCPSCARARTLVERGRTELREVVVVSPPAGLLASLIAGLPGAPSAATPPARDPAAAPVAVDLPEVAAPLAAPPQVDEAPQAAQPQVDETPPAAPPETAVPEVVAPEAAAPEAAAPEAAAPEAAAPEAEAPEADLDVGGETIDLETIDLEEVEEPAADELDELPPPTGEELMQRPALLRPEPAVRRVPSTPARRRTAGVLAGVGLLVLFGLVTALFAMGDDARSPQPQAEQPAIDGDPTTGAQPGGNGAQSEAPGFGPEGEDGGGFAVTGAGLLRSGADKLAPQGAKVTQEEPLRLAVDYRNAVEGITVNAVWRVDGKVFLRLQAVLAGSSSRHVWGLPVPPDGWPTGAHRVLITTDEGLAAAIDFTVTADA